MTDRELSTVQQSWRESAPGRVDRGQLVRRAALVRRRAAAQTILEIAVPIGALVLVLAAMHHAANPVERVLGWVVALAAIAASAVYFGVRRAERAAVRKSAPEYLSMVLRGRRRERQLSVFVLLMLAIECSFLVPWWLGGISQHASRLASPIVVWTFWLPAALIVAIAAWAVGLYVRANQDLRSIGKMVSEFSNG